RDLPAFPTRRSSDLIQQRGPGQDFNPGVLAIECQGQRMTGKRRRRLVGEGRAHKHLTVGRTFAAFWQTAVIRGTTSGVWGCSKRSEEHTSELQSREN